MQVVEQPVITLFCAFTRRWLMERWLSDLSKVKHDPAKTNLAFLIDIDDPYILHQIKRFIKDKGYRNFVFKMNSTDPPSDVRIAARRLRIADMKNQSKFLISMLMEQVLQLETA